MYGSTGGLFLNCECHRVLSPLGANYWHAVSRPHGPVTPSTSQVYPARSCLPRFFLLSPHVERCMYYVVYIMLWLCAILVTRCETFFNL